jgi:hypothetical protein
MVAAQARVATALAARYMVQLCNHFGHRLPATHDQTTGRIDFPDAPVSLTAQEGLLTMTVEAGNETDLDRIKDVMERHLARFAFRDKPEIAWHDVPASQS